MTLSWKAIRRGPIYCAPGCGSKCSWEDYQHAKRKGAALAKRCGPGWRAHVWENMGWHWKAVGSDGAEVYDHGSGRYGIGAPYFWCSLVVAGVRQFSGEAKTPKGAIRIARNNALRALRQLRELARGWKATEGT